MDVVVSSPRMRRLSALVCLLFEGFLILHFLPRGFGVPPLHFVSGLRLGGPASKGVIGLTHIGGVYEAFL